MQASKRRKHFSNSHSELEVKQYSEGERCYKHTMVLKEPQPVQA